MTQAGEQGRETVGEAVTHGSVVKGPRCREGRERNVRGEISQRIPRKPEQKVEEVQSSPAMHWAATGQQKLLGEKDKGQQCFLQPPALQTQSSTMQTKTAEIPVW